EDDRIPTEFIGGGGAADPTFNASTAHVARDEALMLPDADQLWPGQPTTAGGPGSIDEFAAIDGLEGMDEAAPAAAVDSPPVTAPFVAPTPIPTPAPAWNASPSVTEIVPPATPRVEVPKPRAEVPP